MSLALHNTGRGKNLDLFLLSQTVASNQMDTAYITYLGRQPGQGINWMGRNDPLHKRLAKHSEKYSETNVPIEDNL
jgi:hypothetical protein